MPSLTRLLLLITISVSISILSACGVVTDYARDNELDLPIIGQSFESPVRLRVGIIPFEDQALLGSSEAGTNMARLVGLEFKDNPNLLVVDPEDVRKYVEGRGITFPITPEQAMQIGRDLNLNVVMEGAISHVGEHQQRTGWRKLFRWFTDKSQFVDGILLIRAYDPSDGTVITSRSSESNIRVGAAAEPDFDGTLEEFKPNQEEIEASLDDALDNIYYRSLDGLRALPFKAMVKSADEANSKVTIGYGANVGIRKGMRFVLLSYPETITSDFVGYTYYIPGPPIAHLRVESVTDKSATLKVNDGTVALGDMIQTFKRH
ncbi:MAG: hypothetical protein LBE27_02770 [Deltaproteobacteria bacterium]|jgi:hypothetical protein|nr:hypothetical protein [Deltaproteobacteria bacterium]